MQEIDNFPDSFWLEHGGQIRNIREVLETPKTRVGEGILKSFIDNPVFVVYTRLRPTFSSLVAVVEYDEISKLEDKKYFSEPVNQRMVLRAVGLLIEDEIKCPYPEEGKKKYDDYRRFFEGTLSRFAQLDKQIQAGRKPPYFVNSLVIVVCQETKKLKGVENFGLNMEKIRGKIADYLPQLAQINYGSILSGIKNQLETCLVDQTQDKK